MSGYNFTDRVRQALRLAREQAAILQQEQVGAEHILLGLLEEGGGLAATLLDELAVDRERLGEAVRRSAPVGTRADRTWPADLPYSPVAKRVLELAVTEARDLGHTYVGTEHVLLALLHRESVPAVSELERGGARLDSASAACRRLTGTGRDGARPSAGQQPSGAAANGRLALVLAAAALIIALIALALAVARFGR